MALALGASGLTAAYNIANNIPNMIFELVAGGILSSLFIPTYLEVKANRGQEEAGRFAGHVLTLFAVALGMVAVAGTLIPEPFIWTQTFRSASAAGAQVRDTAEFFFRFFAIQVVVYGCGMVVQGVLNAERRYLWTALGPVFNNLVVIATMLAVATMPLDLTGRTVLAIGTTLGVVAMFAVMVPSLVRSGVRLRLGLGLHDADVRRMLVLAVPTVLYVVTNLVAVSFRNASALAVADNGPAVLAYAWTFYQLPYGVLAVALATAVFTEMSDAAGRGDLDAFRSTFTRGLRTTALLVLPAATLLITLATPLSTLYLIGRFDAADVPSVASTLRWWSAGLVFFACMMFVLRAFYSLKDTRTPMLTNLVTTIVQITGYTVLTAGIGAWTGLGITGVPVADGIFYVLQFIVLTLLLRRRIGGIDLRGFAGAFARMGCASALGGVTAWAVSRALQAGVPNAGAALAQVVLGGLAGLAVMYVAARILRIEEVSALHELASKVAGRLTRTDEVA